MLLQLIIIQFITFLAIVFVLRKLLYTETAKEARRLKIITEENSKKQRELREKIEAAEGAYQEKLRSAKEDIRGLQAKADAEIETTRKDMIDKAKEESERIINAAINAKGKIRDEINLEMQKKVPALASRIVREILSPRVKETVHKELIKGVNDAIGNIEKSRFKIKVKKGEITSAYPVEKNEKNTLLSAVFQKLGYKIPFDEKEDGKLVAGVVIRLGTLVIDGSLENRLKQVEKGLK